MQLLGPGRAPREDHDGNGRGRWKAVCATRLAPSWLRWLLGVLVTLSTTNLRAEPTAAPLSISYLPSVACPVLEGFEEELRRRLAVASGNSHTASFQLRVAVAVDGAKFVGELLLREAGGQVTKRQVSGASCHEVVSALALVGALLIESTASELAPTAPARVPDPPAAPPPRKREAPVNIPASAAEPRTRLYRWRVGAGARYHGAVGPSPRPGGEWLGGVLIRWGKLQELLLEVALQSTLEQSRTAASGIASFDWTALSLLACPLRFPTRGAVGARPCAVVELGELTGVGLSTERGAKAGMLWLAPGAVLRLEAPLSGRLTLELGAGIVTPLVRDRFYFEPRSEENVALKVPIWGGRGELLLTARL
jgi:hypothetical protein